MNVYNNGRNERETEHILDRPKNDQRFRWSLHPEDRILTESIIVFLKE